MYLLNYNQCNLKNIYTFNVIHFDIKHPIQERQL